MGRAELVQHFVHIRNLNEKAGNAIGKGEFEPPNLSSGCSSGLTIILSFRINPT